MKNNNEFYIDIAKTVKVTTEDIDDIVATAFEGGINYWCGSARVVGDYLGEYASEQISRGGEVILTDFEDEEEEYTLTRSKLLKGIKLAIDGDYYSEYEWVNGNELDPCQIDAEVADVIIQLALFGEIVYG